MRKTTLFLYFYQQVGLVRPRLGGLRSPRGLASYRVRGCRVWQNPGERLPGQAEAATP